MALDVKTPKGYRKAWNGGVNPVTADQQLIAAAPDLLAACKLAIDAMDRFGKLSPGADDRLRAAIAKAECR